MNHEMFLAKVISNSVKLSRTKRGPSYWIRQVKRLRESNESKVQILRYVYEILGRDLTKCTSFARFLAERSMRTVEYWHEGERRVRLVDWHGVQVNEIKARPNTTTTELELDLGLDNWDVEFC